MNNEPTLSDIVDGLMAETIGKSKKKVCCCPPDVRIELAKELESASEKVRARYKEVEF